MKETLGTITQEAAEVVSEDEDTEISRDASTYRTVLSSKGSLCKRVANLLSNEKMKKQKTSACMTVISSDNKNKERLCCLFPGVSPGNLKKKSTRYSRTNSVYSAHRKQWKKFLKTSTSAQIINNKQSLKIMW